VELGILVLNDLLLVVRGLFPGVFGSLDRINSLPSRVLVFSHLEI